MDWKKEFYYTNEKLDSDIMAFWEGLGEKPSVNSSVGAIYIPQPMTQFFQYCGWIDPMPTFFFTRMTKFIKDSLLINRNPKFRTLADLVVRGLAGEKLGQEELPRWAEKYLGVELGERPDWNEAANERWKSAKDEYYSRRRRYGARCNSFSDSALVDPNWRYHKWMKLRDAAAERARPLWTEMREHILRHIVNPEDYDIGQRNGFLELMGRTLYRGVWFYAGGWSASSGSWRTVSHTKQSWDDKGKSETIALIDLAAERQREFCRFSACDFDALSTLLGAERDALLQFMQSRAYAKIEAARVFAHAELDKFSNAVQIASQTSISRNYEQKAEFKILKSNIKVVVKDLGEVQRFGKWLASLIS